MTDVTGTTSWGYDAASRVTSVAAPQGGVTYTYNPDGSRALMTPPGGKAVSYAYDGDGRLSSVSDWLSRTISLSYTVDGLEAGITRPDGVTTTQTYDAADRLTAIAHTGPGNTALRHFTYTLDAAGNRTAVVSDAGTESYTLDALNRITGVTYPQGDTASYTYDANGNRLTKTTTAGGTTTYTYDDADQLLSDGTNSYSYDANGNLLTAGSSVYTWDYANRLATAHVGSTTASYSYDGDGTRTSKTVGSTTTPYVWDREAGLPLLASDGTTSYLSDSSGSLLGQLDASNNPTYYLDDALGSVRGTSGAAGTLAGSVDYDVFGVARATSGVQPGAGLGYTGQQADAETGFAYLRARDYSPSLGRFVSADSVAPNAAGTQGYNLYAYVANNPTTWADLSGHGVPLDLINQIGTARALEAACFSTPWCTALVAELTYQYLKDVAEVWPSGTGVTLATLGFFIGLVYVGVACLIDVTSGPDHLNHCFYTDGQTTTLTGSTGPCSGPPKPPTRPSTIVLLSTTVGPSSIVCGAGGGQSGGASGCQYQGGGLWYVDGDPDRGKQHILDSHKRHAAPQVPRIRPQGVFLSDDWGDISGVIGDADTDFDHTGVNWQVQGNSCVMEYRFNGDIGYDDPPEAGGSRPLGATGTLTPCLRTVIVNQPAPAEVITSYPIAC